MPYRELAALNEPRHIVKSRVHDIQTRANLKRSIPQREREDATVQSSFLAALSLHDGYIAELMDRTEPPKRQEQPFKTFGEQLLAIRNAALYPHLADSKLNEVNKRGVGGALGASEAVPADGGFLIQSDFARNILIKAYLAGQFLQRANYIPITKPNATSMKVPAIDEQSRTRGSRWGGVNSYWQNEADTLTATRAKFRVLDVPLGKLTGLSYSTEELIDDAGSYGEIMSQAFGSELAYRGEEAMFTGDGSAGKPLGMLNAKALITVPAESGQASGTILAQNVAKMWAQCWGPSRSRACWFVNQNVEPQLVTLSLPLGTGGSAIPLYQFSESDEDPFNRLCGRPVIPVEYLPSLGTVGDIMLVDPYEYAYSDKGGIDGALSLHVKFLTDEGVYRFIWRVAGTPTWHTSITPAVGSLPLSPYVALAAR